MLALCDLILDLPPHSAFEHSAHHSSTPPQSVFSYSAGHGSLLSSGNCVRNGMVHHLEGKGLWEMVGNCCKSDKCSVSPVFDSWRNQAFTLIGPVGV